MCLQTIKGEIGKSEGGASAGVSFGVIGAGLRVKTAAVLPDGAEKS